MPVFSRKYEPVQRKTTNGSTSTVNPIEHLAGVGPVVDVRIEIMKSFSNPGKKREQPRNAEGKCLIDTGAGKSCIDEAIAAALGLPVINTATVASASHASTKQNVYPVQIAIHGVRLVFETPALGAQLKNQGLVALLGRDVLKHCILTYNGFVGQFTLAI